jgi:hypothetical protein
MAVEDFPEGRWQVYGTYHKHPEQPQGISASFVTKTPEEAKEIASQFSKSAKVRGTTLSTYSRENPDQSLTRGTVHFQANLSPSGVNRGINETGLKRYRSFRKTAEKLGHPVEWHGPTFSNAYKNEDDFEQALRGHEELFHDRRK